MFALRRSANIAATARSLWKGSSARASSSFVYSSAINEPPSSSSSLHKAPVSLFSILARQTAIPTTSPREFLWKAATDSFVTSLENDIGDTEIIDDTEREQDTEGHGIFLISTLKRRRKMMNKHKLRKRRKKNRMKTKK